MQMVCVESATILVVKLVAHERWLYPSKSELALPVFCGISTPIPGCRGRPRD